MGVPVLPLALPGAAVSPGTRICSLLNVTAFTVMEGLLLLVIPAWVTSEAVIVALPTVLSVTLKLWLPLTNAALDGSAAFRSLELIETVSFVLTTFQFASTALTVTLNGVPAVCATGVPVLPATVPDMAVSPGTSNCNFASAPALTTNDVLD